MAVNRSELSEGAVAKEGKWAVGEAGGEVFAVSRRCRHQFADLTAGKVDADGCLVCPWHQARYEPAIGVMVDGPRGFLGYHGPVPGLSGAVKLMTRLLPLRRGTIVTDAGDRITVR